MSKIPEFTEIQLSAESMKHNFATPLVANGREEVVDDKLFEDLCKTVPQDDVHLYVGYKSAVQYMER